MVEVFAMICAVLYFCYKLMPNIPLYFSIKSRIFSRPLLAMAALR